VTVKTKKAPVPSQKRREGERERERKTKTNKQTNQPTNQKNPNTKKQKKHLRDSSKLSGASY
jgi:hypothetical protein